MSATGLTEITYTVSPPIIVDGRGQFSRTGRVDRYAVTGATAVVSGQKVTRFRFNGAKIGRDGTPRLLKSSFTSEDPALAPIKLIGRRAASSAGSVLGSY